jgi:hypothetical protein
LFLFVCVFVCLLIGLFVCLCVYLYLFSFFFLGIWCGNSKLALNDVTISGNTAAVDTDFHCDTGGKIIAQKIRAERTNSKKKSDT